jgi:hypothetical protein
MSHDVQAAVIELAAQGMQAGRTVKPVIVFE